MAMNFYQYTKSADKYGAIAKPEPVKPSEPGLLSNMGRSAASGALSGVGGIFDFVGADGIAKQFYGWSDDARQSMSQEAQADMAKPFFSENDQGDIQLGEGLTDLDTWLLTMANVAGQFTPTAIPGAGFAGAATKALKLSETGAKIATAIGMGATGGASATGQGMEQARQEWLQMPDELKLQSDLFKNTIREMKQARPDLDGEELWTEAENNVAERLAAEVQTDPKVLLANFAGSAIADPIIGRALTGARLAKSGALRSALVGFAAEGATEAAQAGVQEYGVNQALSQVDGRDPMDGVAIAALNEGIAGGAFGAAAGGAGGIANRQSAEPVRDSDADAIRDSNPALAGAIDGMAQSAAQREADLQSVIGGMPAISQPALEGELLSPEQAPVAPLMITDKNIFFAGDGRPQQAAQEFTDNLQRQTNKATSVPRLPQKDIIFAGDQSGVRVKGNGQVYQSAREAMTSKQARAMKRNGKPVEAVPFGDGWGWRVKEGDSLLQTSTAPGATPEDGGPRTSETLGLNLQQTEPIVAEQVDQINQQPIQLMKSGRPFSTQAMMLKSASYKEAAASGAELEPVKVEGGYGFRVKATSVSDQVAVTQSPETDPALQAAPEVQARPVQSLQPDPAGDAPAADLSGEAIDGEWTAFAEDSGTLKIPRAEMPQIKAEHRGAMTQFLKARGVNHEQDTVPAAELKPTQAEFSPSKVAKAMEFDGGDRSILVSSDGYVLDGHHQWLAKRERGEQVDIIRFDAPIADLVKQAHEFPSSTVADGATAKAAPALAESMPETQPEASSNNDEELPAILRATKKKYIAQQVKQQKLKESSPGYAQAVSRLEDQYEADIDRAQAGLTFEQFNTLNADSPESVNRQAYKALREEFGLPVDMQFSKTKKMTPAIESAVTAIRTVATTQVDVQDAVVRDDIGSVDFVWGDEGAEPSRSGKRKGAKGIAHIIEARMRKDGFSLPKVFQLLDNIAETVATGNIVKTSAIGDTQKTAISDGKHTAWLVKSGDDNHWLLTGWEEAGASGELSEGHDSSQPTSLKPTPTRLEDGAEARKQSIAENSTTEQPQQLDSKKPEQVRLIGSQSPLSGSPDQVSVETVQPDSGTGNPDIQFTQQNTIKAKPARGVNSKLAKQLVTNIMQRLNGAAGIKVVVLETQAQAEKLWQMSLAGDLVRGAYDRSTKTAYVIAENLKSLDELREVVAHEVIGHGGLQNVIGKADYTAFIERLKQTRNNRAFAKQWALIDYDYDGFSESDKAEELFAYFVQNKSVTGPVKFWWNALTRFLHKALVKVGLAKAGDPDVEAMQDMLESIRAGFMFSRGDAVSGADSELAFSKTRTTEQTDALDKLGLGEEAAETVAEQAKRRANETVDTLKSSSFWKRLNEGIFDGLAGIKQAEEAAGITDPNKQGYVSARLASGLSDILHGVFHYGAPVWKDGVVQRKADTKGLLEVFGMLGDDLNDWLAWMGANRAERLMAEGRENNLSQADIDELKAMAAGKEELFEQVRQEYNKINSAIIDLAEEAGLISAEQRGGFDEEWYVPFFRNMENEVDPEMVGIAAMVHGPRSRNGIAGQSAQIKELKGGRQSTKDLLENIIARQSTLIDAAIKNKAMAEVVSNLEGTPFMQAVDSPDIAALSQTELNLLQKVKVMRNGKAEAYTVTDPALLRGLLQIHTIGNQSLFNRMARSAKRFLTAGITLSPDFIIKNFVRDAAHAWMINKDGFRFGADSVAGLRKAFAEDEAYRDLIFSGAAFQGGYVHGADPEAAAQQVRRALRSKGLGEADIQSYMDSLITKGGQLLEAYRTASDKVENANRLSTYEAALASGKSRRQAAYEAKDLMDYSLKGNFALIGTMIDMLPFFNARLQGMSKLVRAMKAGDGDRVLKVLSANLAMKGLKVAAFSLALAAMNDDDERYQELPDWDKDANWHFFIGDEHFRIPKPFELGILFGTMPERMFHYAAGSQPGSDLGKAAAHAVWNTLALNPIPQLALPVVEVMTNKSFFKGSQIEGMGDAQRKPEDRYNAYTSETAKQIGAAFGVSPKMVEHLILGYTGTLGGYVLGMSDIAARQMLGIEAADTPISRYPVIKAFYQGDAPKTATKFQDEFYKALEEATEAHGSYKRAVEEGNVVRQQDLKESESLALGARVALNRIQRRLSELNKQAELVNNNQNLNGEQKRQKLDDITKKKNALYQSAYVRYKLGEW